MKKRGKAAPSSKWIDAIKAITLWSQAGPGTCKDMQLAVEERQPRWCDSEESQDEEDNGIWDILQLFALVFCFGDQVFSPGSSVATNFLGVVPLWRVAQRKFFQPCLLGNMPATLPVKIIIFSMTSMKVSCNENRLFGNWHWSFILRHVWESQKDERNRSTPNLEFGSSLHILYNHCNAFAI